MPCIWQTSMTDDPGATLCAKIRSFSSTLQRRRRFGPARTSPWTSRALIRVLRRSSLSISVPSPITPPPKTKAAESRSPCRRQKRPSADAYLDHAGQTVDLLDGSAGEIRPAQIFVAVTDASNYAYAEATPTQGLPDRVAAHVPALAFVGGVPLQPVLTTRRSGSIAPTGTSPASTAPPHTGGKTLQIVELKVQLARLRRQHTSQGATPPAPDLSPVHCGSKPHGQSASRA